MSDPESNQDLKARIEAAKNKRDPKKNIDPSKTKIDAKGMGDAMRASIELVTGIGVGTFIGYWIDKWLGTAPFGMIIMFFLGFAAGFLNIYKAQTGTYHKTGTQQLTKTEKNGEKEQN